MKKFLFGLAAASVLATTMIAAPASAQPYYGPDRGFHRDREVIVRRGPICSFRTVVSRDRWGHRVVSRVRVCG